MERQPDHLPECSGQPKELPAEFKKLGQNLGIAKELSE